VAVQPFVPVTVTEYRPATLVGKLAAVEVKPPGPAQLYVTPAVVVVTDTVAVVRVQFNGPVLLAKTPAGGAMFCWITDVATAVQPLAAVTVTE
jgi:hypothetical protein